MDFRPKIIYQDDNFILVRKPNGIASSWGQEACFLDRVKKYSSDFLSSCGTGFSISEIPDQVRNDTWQHQISTFGEDGEYGLLNRLDTVTAGLLYFARSYEAKEKYIHLQEQGLITKTYYAQVYGSPRAKFGRITTPIYHHRDDASRMTTYPEKGRGKGQEVVTYREYASPSFPLPDGKRDDHRYRENYGIDESPSSGTEISHQGQRGWGEACWLKIQITSGCRHQIRCHLASIGYPIIGDRLYMSKGLKKQYPEYDDKKIELLSVGLEIIE